MSVAPLTQPFRPQPSDLHRLLALTASSRGSDLHLSAGQRPRLRVDGEIVVVESWPALAPEQLAAFFADIAPPANAARYDECGDTDFALTASGLRFRVNLFRDQHGPGAVLRLIADRIPTVAELGLPEAIVKLADLPKGLVLVTGPTGSGKSTTLAALIDRINESKPCHILTIEDPIEYLHPSKRALVNQREVGLHTGSFKAALRAGLREDPDVILVGELRDLETVSIALETAETGHLVFGTLHTTTAMGTIERVIDQFPGDQQGQIRTVLAESLRGVVAQTLLRRTGGGRVAAFEVLLGNPAVTNLVREGKTHQLVSILQTNRANGMRLMADSLVELVERGVVAPEEAIAKAYDPDGLAMQLKLRRERAAAGPVLVRPPAGDAPPRR